LLKLTFAMDAREAASQLQTPVLVLHRLKDSTVAFDAGRRLASTLRNAQFVSIAGRAHLPWAGEESAQFVEEILRFTDALANTPVEQPTHATHNQFRKTGDVWTLSFAGKTAHLKDSLGLQDLATLLAHKGQDIHVNELTSGREAAVVQQETPVLDEQAIRQYRQRLQEIIEEKQGAAETGDDEDYERLENEQDVLTQVLNEGLGLGGRQRMLNSETEKARKAISARVRSTIKRIGAVHPALAEHLNHRISTGTFCSYSSPEPIDWLI
ncbi:MAG: alpha/beta fold hydrolase, partial [Pseudomonadales bacterium]